jgi:phage pi2 protein 07
MKFDLSYNEKIDKRLSSIVTFFLKKISSNNMISIFFEKEDVVVELIDTKLNKLPIKIILNENIINIYIGKNLEHYIQDVVIRTPKDEEELATNLTKILSSEIKEVIDKGGFAYYSTSNDWKWNSNYNNKMNSIESETIYEPWIIKK